MKNRDSIFKYEKCELCQGLGFLMVQEKNDKLIKRVCPHCEGKGHLRMLKHDYDY